MPTRSEIETAKDPLSLVTRDLIELVNSVPGAEQPELLNALTRGQRIVWGSFMVVGEVNNGGFNQFFWNNSRHHVELAQEAFRLLGASEHLQLLGDAVRRLEGATDRLAPYARRDTLEAFSESYGEAVFDDLDQRFFELDCAPLLIDYIRSHPHEFVR